jgi:Bacterial regulatory proteins, luxR family
MVHWTSYRNPSPGMYCAGSNHSERPSSKKAGRTLGISPRTVDFHRANLLKKLGARNAADLVHNVLGE